MNMRRTTAGTAMSRKVSHEGYYFGGNVIVKKFDSSALKYIVQVVQSKPHDMIDRVSREGDVEISGLARLGFLVFRCDAPPDPPR